MDEGGKNVPHHPLAKTINGNIEHFSSRLLKRNLFLIYSHCHFIIKGLFVLEAAVAVL